MAEAGSSASAWQVLGPGRSQPWANQARMADALGITGATLTHHPGALRATIHPYVDGTPGPFYYQRAAHPVGAEAERLLGGLEGGHALLFPSGSGATTALALGLLEPGARVAVADGGYYGTLGLLGGELARWGLKVTTFDQTGPPPPADLVWPD